MKVYTPIMLICLVSPALYLSVPAVAADKSELKKTVVSPHSDAGDCAICHVAPPEKLRGWFVFASTKRELKDDLNRVCQKCHEVETNHAGGIIGVGKGHAISKKPEVNNRNLPLAGDGTITCATTCHNMHITSEDLRQQKKRLRLPFNALCVSCHDR